jgi:flavin reductase (DIM6/NTAB) family NADH-FMN oxidoreductase RutF
VREAFAHYPSGVVALIAALDAETVGLVASSFTVGVAADPPLVSVAVQRTSTSWPRLKSAKRIGVSVFSDGQAGLARQIADSRLANRFGDVGLVDGGSAARFIVEAAGWFECAIYDEVEAGDHTVALLEVLSARVDHQRLPLIFHGSAFREMATSKA